MDTVAERITWHRLCNSHTAVHWLRDAICGYLVAPILCLHVNVAVKWVYDKSGTIPTESVGVSLMKWSRYAILERWNIGRTLFPVEITARHTVTSWLRSAEKIDPICLPHVYKSVKRAWDLYEVATVEKEVVYNSTRYDVMLQFYHIQ